MDAVTEGQVPAGIPVQLQCVGIGELLRVAVGGLDRDGDRLAGPDQLSVQFDVRQRRPHPGVGDAQVSQQFLDGPFRDARIGAQRGQPAGFRAKSH